MVPARVGPSSSSSIPVGAAAAVGTALQPHRCAHHRCCARHTTCAYVSRQPCAQAVDTAPPSAVVPRLASLAVSSSSSSRTRPCQNTARTGTSAASVAAGSQSAADTAFAAAAATTEALLEWMQQQGCVVGGVQLDYSQGAAGQIYRELKALNVSVR